MRSGKVVMAFSLLAAYGCSGDLQTVELGVSALTQDPPIVISQVYGGGGNSGAPYQNDFVELFNRSSGSVALDALSLQYASATGTGNLGANAATLVTFPAGASLEAGKYYLVQLAGNMSVGAALPTPDLAGQAIAVSSSAGKLALVTGSSSLGCNGAGTPCIAEQEARIVDLVGFGNASFAEGSAAASLTNATAAIRRNAGCADTNDNLADFEVRAPAPRNSATPAAVCGSSPVEDAGTPQEDAGQPPVEDAGPPPELVAVHTVQGAAHLSPFQDQAVNVGPAIVTALRSNGFYMQDPTPDEDDATSEGIFVYAAAAPSVSVGARVTVQGRVQEYRAGCTPSCAASTSAFDNLSTTEIIEPQVTVLDTGNDLPAAIALGNGAGQRAVPLRVICDDAASSNVESGGAFDPANDGIDFYESLEGMRVQIDGAAVVDPSRAQSDSTVSIGVLARADAGLRTARGGILATENDFNPERVFLSSALQPSFPTVVVGDSFDGAIVGVIDYSFANYRLIATEPLPAVTSGGLTQETTALVASTPSQLSIASMNVENLDALDAASKFSELAKIVVDHLRSPDLIALEEVQDNNGAQNTGVVSASNTLATFIGAIATAGGPTYEYRQIDPDNNTDGGEPGGNIRVVFLFRSDRGLAFVERGSATATAANSVDASSGTPHLALSPGRIEPSNSAWSSSRKPLAGEFTFAGKTFFVIGNHFNSKGGDDPLFGRTQPPVLSSETQRVQQATLVAGFVESILKADPNAFVVTLGDFNDFSFSRPLQILQDTGLTDMIHTLPENERYTYLYQGNSQDLDHILVSPALAPLASYDVVHVNAEFAVQASDHEPAVVRIDLGSTEQPPQDGDDGDDEDDADDESRPRRAARLWATFIRCALFPRYCPWN